MVGQRYLGQGLGQGLEISLFITTNLIKILFQISVRSVIAVKGEVGKN
jgi:hypothetical protein